MQSTILFFLFVYAVYHYVRRRTVKTDYTGKTVWITGASSGIGEHLAYEFNKKGAHIIISARNQKELERVKQASSSPERVEIIPLDMTNYDDVNKKTQELIKRLESQERGLDVVVENAGVSMRCSFIEYPFQNHKSMFDVNVHAPFYHIKCFLQHMINRRSGHIVGITSIAGQLATSHRSSYAGSKHAFIGILDSLRAQIKEYGIKVTNVMPGYIRTNLSKNAFASKPGQKFGITDTNIENGMDPQNFAKQTVGAIYLGQSEVQVSNQWLHIPAIVFRNLCPDLTFKFLEINKKNQEKAIREGKKE